MAGNWKMNATHLEAIQMVQKLTYRLEPGDYERVEVAVIPPFTALRSVQTVVDMDNLPVSIGAQNVHWADSGAYTGEISAQMLAKLSVSYVVIGHSERRAMFGETDETVNKKTKAVLAAGMTPIVALGETLEQREAGQVEDVCGSQLHGALKGLDADAVAGLVVAYEPVWAIGTGRHAEPGDAQDTIGFLREQIRERFADAADHTRILYGGSVNAGNVAAIMAKKDIDGGLVGGASLDPDNFASVIRYWA
jgi:triosephosphate isomerase